MLAPPPAAGAPAAPVLDGIGFTQRLGTQLPAQSPLTASNGQPTTLAAAIDNRPTVLMLGYFNCRALCGVERDAAFQALSLSGLRPSRDYSLVFLSIDPAERPADADMAKRADLARTPEPGAAAGWHYVTADAPTIDRIEEAVGFRSRYDVALRQFLHPAGLVILTPGGMVSGYLLGASFQPGGLAAALARARAGTIGQRATGILLLCFHYDPDTGRYSLAILKVLRVMAVLTLAGIGILLLLLRRRRRAA